MIPTREQIDVSNGILCAMRDEIDRLTADNAELRERVLGPKPPIGPNPSQIGRAHV